MAKPAITPIPVRATKRGFFGAKKGHARLVNPGEEFVVPMNQFSPDWMEKIAVKPKRKPKAGRKPKKKPGRKPGVK